MISSNVTLTGTASFGSNSAANTVWVSVNGSAFQQAAITGSTTSNVSWSYNVCPAPVSVGNNTIRYFAMDAYNNCGSTNSSTLVDYFSGICKVVITGTNVGGGGGAGLSWNSIDSYYNVNTNQNLVGGVLNAVLCSMNATDPTTSPYVFSGGFPITPGTYFVLQGVGGGSSSGILTRTFWFYDQNGNCVSSNAVTEPSMSNIFYAPGEPENTYTIFCYNGSNVSVVSSMPKMISKIVITGTQVGGGGDEVMYWCLPGAPVFEGSLVGGINSNMLCYISNTDPTTSPYVFDGGTPIQAGTSFVLDGGSGGGGSGPLSRTFWFYDQTGNCFSTNTISESSMSEILYYTGSEYNTNYTQFTFDGNTVQTSQQ
jgi:hypothetical protein